MADTFDELVEKQQVADEAHAKVLELRDRFGAPMQQGGWTARQSETYETAWRAWRDLTRDVQAAATEYAKATGQERAEVEAAVRRRAGSPEAQDQ
ncbi:hypothetical protein ACFYP4_21330 [Streptomyces sp. NPDC005551]|uniref:hypothetical protein n=1 Tax=unclassified Streptomyces TaxID=2593676 RepID=UPI00340406F3